MKEKNHNLKIFLIIRVNEEGYLEGEYLLNLIFNISDVLLFYFTYIDISFWYHTFNPTFCFKIISHCRDYEFGKPT